MFLSQLVQQSETTPLGLKLLTTASEELAVPREDLSMARKDELHKLLLQQVPTILGVLNSKNSETSENMTLISEPLCHIQ